MSAIAADRPPLVELEHVSVIRGDNVVLQDVSLRIASGEQLALLGPNGCGKSTLLKVMTCELYPLVKPETRVRLFGRERWDTTELRRRLGVVAADLPGRPMLETTGFDAVLTGFFSSSTMWPHLPVSATMRERAEAILHLVGAAPLRNKPVGAMSAGQQRRVMIGRAMAGATGDGTGGVEMLLLDEPTNALDLGAQYDLRAMLGEVARTGTAIVLVTHQISDVLPGMGRVLLMHGGRMVGDGPTEKMLTSARLSELFGRAVEVDRRQGVYYAR